MACKACRAKKIKCDRVRPVCQNCRQRASHCSYAGERRVRRWTEADADNRRLSTSQNDQSPSVIDLGQRSLPRQPDAGAAACHVEQGLCVQSTTRLTHRMPDGTAQNDAASDCLDWSIAIAAPAARSDWQTMDSNSMASLFAQMARDGEVILQTPADSTSTQGESLLDKILDGDEDLESLKDASPALWGRTTDGDEYTGPSSGISTVSDLGLNWIRDKVPDSNLLCETIQDIRNAILVHIRQPKCITQDLPLALSTSHRILDIPRPQLLEYIDAYFTEVQVVFPILDRDTFDSQLTEMGDGSDVVQKPSWLALLNVVVASGLRASLSDETSEAFRTSVSEAWGYFRSALSYESQIVHGATDLLAVQAVALMAVFAQGLSSPQRLEYTLSSVALRLAQSIGLNCASPPEWSLSDVEKKERNRVFWAVYCLDKSIALRCGRPAVICDEEISCPFPRGIDLAHPGSATNVTEIGEEELDVDFFRYFTKLARIGGDISRSLYSASALFMPISRLVPALNRLLQELERWLKSIPIKVRPGRPLGKILGRQGVSRVQIIVLHSSYYYALCSIFRRGSPMFNQGKTDVEHLIDGKSHISHIEAARSIVLLTKHLDIESFTPAWLVFYYPFTALTTIFVHVVSNPHDSRNQSDIALMETVVGFFGRLEYVTSGEAAFTKTTEFVRQARRVVDSYKNKGDSRNIQSTTSYEDLMTSMEISLQGDASTQGRPAEVTGVYARNSITASQGISAFNTTGTSLLPLAKSSRMEAVSEEDHPVSGVPNVREIEISQNGHTIYSDLAGFTVPNMEDSIQVQW
ncbi:fungal specific transcription factor domain-containing protein [Colletotrichum scovillei]|uniref:Fungal specific transcription factor domain-containing protein n=2 Tax=Colletotrichum scovillei TaxID=1209932 RepID=A0A9P7QPQ7_9PEZI|nr:fungal specific transcription factor domain-containing protein [Colletotrichum scovillei]KAG7040715.1 fungal specific transcription factor domain-containing protein [Colletotrichum scovillei]KAG7060759.1 fungal specific transcription factor domain-containing protein [Colletotrichum scovillei]